MKNFANLNRIHCLFFQCKLTLLILIIGKTQLNLSIFKTGTDETRTRNFRRDRAVL